jgi:predicted MFS family arabinose efflux permease
VIGVSIGLSFYLALVLGPVLVNFAGLSGLFYLTATLAVAGIFLVLYAVPDTQSKAPAGDTLPSQSNLAALLVDPHLMRLNLGVMLLHMLITVFFVAFPPVLIEVGIPLSKHWQSYLPVLCVSVLIMSLLMGLTPRLGQRRLIVVCLLMLSAAFAGMSWQANNLLILLLLACVFFGGFNYLEANFPAMVSQLAPAGMRGSAMGVYASFQFFGAFLGGLIAGISRQTGSDQLPLLIGSGICLGWLLFAPKSLTQDKGKVKRLTLAFQPQQPEAVIQQKLTSVLGIIEANIDQQQNVVYLKVNSNQFELAQAQRALQSE